MSLAQRLFWYIWNDDHRFVHLALPPMLLAFLDIFVLISVWFWAYHVQDWTVATMSGIPSILVVLVWLIVTGAVLWYGFHVYLEHVEGVPMAEKDLNQRFEEEEHGLLLFVALGVLIWFTAVACIDSRRD